MSQIADVTGARPGKPSGPKHRLEAVEQTRWQTCKHAITVVQATVNKSANYGCEQCRLSMSARPDEAGEDERSTRWLYTWLTCDARDRSWSTTTPRSRTQRTGGTEAPGRSRGSAGNCARRREDPSQMTSVLAGCSSVRLSLRLSVTHTSTDSKLMTIGSCTFHLG